MRLKRRTINNIKIAVVYASMIYFCHTLRTLAGLPLLFFL